MEKRLRFPSGASHPVEPRLSSLLGIMSNHFGSRKIEVVSGFRPYAPVVLLEHAAAWFDGDAARLESPFMLRVMRVKPERRAQVPGIVHVDGTGRVQTVSRQTNPRLYDLLSAFYARTGVPMLLNTSFNAAGEPIVETPSDAIWCFAFTGLDACVLEDAVMVRDADAGDPLSWRPSLRAAWEYCPPAASQAAAADQSTRRLFLSACAGDDRAEQRTAGREARLRVRGPWGDVRHLLGCDLAAALQLMDGERTAAAVHEELQRAGVSFSAKEFSRLLARLASTGIIALDGRRAASIAAAHSLLREEVR